MSNKLMERAEKLMNFVIVLREKNHNLCIGLRFLLLELNLLEEAIDMKNPYIAGDQLRNVFLARDKARQALAENHWKEDNQPQRVAERGGKRLTCCNCKNRWDSEQGDVLTCPKCNSWPQEYIDWSAVTNNNPSE